MDQTSEGAAAPESAPVTTEAPAQDTAETKVETAADSQPAVKKDDEQPEVKGVQRRFDELTRLRRDAERDRDHWRELAMRQKPPEPTPPPAAEQPKTLKDFNYDERAYQDHLYGEARKHAEKAARDAGERWKAEQEAVSRRAKFDERVAQFSKTVEDYSSVVTDTTPVSEGMADFLLDSEEAGAVMYYLGKNPEEARKLYYLSPAKAGRELTKLEDRLIAERKKAAAKPVSNAPPPPPQVEGGSASPGVVKVDTGDSDTLSDAEWTKRRNAQEAARRKRARGD